MYRMSEKNSYDEGEDEIYRSTSRGKYRSEVYPEPYGTPTSVDGIKGRTGNRRWNESSKLDCDTDSETEGNQSSRFTAGHVNYDKQSVSASRNRMDRRSATLTAILPYQTITINVLTQCEECVRKVKKAVARAEGRYFPSNFILKLLNSFMYYSAISLFLLLKTHDEPYQRVSSFMKGVESIDVDMNLKKITVSGHIDPQVVMKKASKTGKSVQLSSSKGSGIKPVATYEQQTRGSSFNQKHDNVHNPGDYSPHKIRTDRYQNVCEDYNIMKGKQQMKGVKFNLTPGEDPRNNKGISMQKNATQYRQGSNGNTKKENFEYHQQESPEMQSDWHFTNQQYDQRLKGEKMTTDLELYKRSGGQKFKQKGDHDTQASGEMFKQNLTYPASRDDGSYVYIDEDANSCSVM